MKNILSIDTEEYFYSEYVRCRGYHGSVEYRTPCNLEYVLEILDEFGVSATFFVVGEIVEGFPEVVEKIHERGHELAFHGWYHEPLWRLSAESLRIEIKKFSSFTKERCLGFRAPDFSLSNETRWALKVLEDAGFIYDSSIFPTKTPLYGVWRAPTNPYKPSHEDVTKEDENGKLWEFPLLVYPLLGFKIPMAGGFYLRFFPINLIRKAVQRMNKHGFPAVIYVHNWELDPDMPKAKVGLLGSFITYCNIEQTERKLKHLLSNFEFMSFADFIKESGLTHPT